MDKIKNKLCKVCSKKSRFKCEQCGKVSYCSRECQFKDWNRHKNNCKYNSTKKLKSTNINNNNKVNNIYNFNYKDYKRKKTDTNKKIELALNMRGARRERHCQTISIKPNNLGELHYSKKHNNNYGDLDNISEEQNSFEKTKKEEIKIEFHFVEKFKDIFFQKGNNNVKIFNDSEGSSFGGNNSYEKDKDFKNDRINKLYNLLIEHRNFLTEKILLKPNRTYYFTSIVVMLDTYYGIEKYILNFLLLIKFLYFQKDPISLMKADKALNALGKELFNYNNNKNGLLVFSIDCIFNKFLEVIDTKKNFYQVISSIQEVSKRFLSLISCINKLSLALQDNKMYLKSLSYYNKFFELSLKFISSGKLNEKIILRSNLKFHIGCYFSKNKYLNTSLNIFKEILNIQKDLEPCSFICGVVYYNISIIYYVMDKIKESELYLNEGFDKINKILDLKKLSKQREDFRRLIRLLLLFYAELNIERDNYPKAVQCLKAVIEIMIDDSQNIKIRHKTQISNNERQSFKFLKHMKFMLGNYTKNKLLSPKIISNMDKDFTLKNKIKVMTPLEYLYEIQFFNIPSDKVVFDENIKSIINFLFERISFYYN